MQILLHVSEETFFERVSNTVKLGVVKKVNTQKSRKNEKGVGKSVTHLTFGSTFCNMKMTTIFLSTSEEQTFLSPEKPTQNSF